MNIHHGRSKSNQKQGGSLEPRQGQHILVQNFSGDNQGNREIKDKKIDGNQQLLMMHANHTRVASVIEGQKILSNLSGANIYNQVNKIATNAQGSNNSDYYNKISKDKLFKVSGQNFQGKNIAEHQINIDSGKQISNKAQVQDASQFKKNLNNSGIGSQQTISQRKHSSVRRNHQTEKMTQNKNQERFINNNLQTIQIDVNGQNQQWMTQTQPSRQNQNIEGGSSGGSGFKYNEQNFIIQNNMHQLTQLNQTQILDHSKQTFSQTAGQSQDNKKLIQKKHPQQLINQNMIQENQNQFQTNQKMKNRPNPELLLQMEQLSRQEKAQNNFYTNSINTTQQKLPQNKKNLNIQNQFNSVHSNEGKGTIPKNPSLTIQQHAYNNGIKNQGIMLGTVVNNQMINQMSSYNIGQNQGHIQNQQIAGIKYNQQILQQNIPDINDIQYSQINSAVSHQKNKSSSIINPNPNMMTLHTKKSSYQLEKEAALEQKFKQEQTLFLDSAIIENHQKLGPRNSNQMTQMTQNIKQISNQKQGSKLRKNVSTIRNPIVQQGIQNGQRVSCQRRFNNTTLDNYQQQIHQQFQNFNQNTIQQTETVIQNMQTIQQIQQALGTINSKNNQSRSVLRQNQQLKQFRNNYLPATKYTQITDSNNAIMTIQNNQDMKDTNQNQLRINNQLINNRNEINNRAHSTLKTQAFHPNQTQIQSIVTQQNHRQINSQMNNFLIQQNHNDILGQSPPTKKNYQNIHKKNEPAKQRRPNENQEFAAQNIENSVLEINESFLPQQLNQGIKNQGKQTNGSLNSTDDKNVQKSESEQSSAIHRQYLAEGPIDGRLSSIDQDSSQMNQGARGLHFRRNQPQNFSNVSEKSSLMGDYGGTHTAHTSNQAKVAGRQTSTLAIHPQNLVTNSDNSQAPSVMNINIQNQSLKGSNQFFKNRNNMAEEQSNQNILNPGTQKNQIIRKSSNKSRGLLIRGATPQQQNDQFSDNLITNQVYKNNEVTARRGSLPEQSNLDQQAYQNQFQTLNQQKSMVVREIQTLQQKSNLKDQNLNTQQNRVQKIQQIGQNTQVIQRNDDNRQQISNVNPNNQIEGQKFRNKNTEENKQDYQSHMQLKNKLQNNSVLKNKQIQNPQFQIPQQKQVQNIQIQKKDQSDTQNLKNKPTNDFGFLIDPSIIKGVIENSSETAINHEAAQKLQKHVQSLPQSKKSTQAVRKQVKIIKMVSNNQNDNENEFEENDNTVVNFFSEKQTNQFVFQEDDLLEDGGDNNTYNNEDVGQEGFEIVESMQQTVSQKNDNFDRSGSQKLSFAINETPGNKFTTAPNLILPGSNTQELSLIQNKQPVSNVVMIKNIKKIEIGTKDQIVIKDNNVFLNAEDSTEQDQINEPIAKLMPVKSKNIADLFPKLNSANIVIQDNSMSKDETENKNRKIQEQKEEEQKKIINYETFESSSEDEFSCGAFESAAASFQNKEKEINLMDIQDQKRIEKQRRKERKALEKKKLKAEQDREGRKNLRKKYRLLSIGQDHYDQYQDDVINYKDSERDSVISYFEGDLGTGIEIVSEIKKNKGRTNKKVYHYNDDFFYRKALIDTPTRLINNSNEFLPKKKKINPDKLEKKRKNQNVEKMINFKDLEKFSDVEKSQKSTQRRAEEEKKQKLINMFGQNEIDQLKNEIKMHLDTKKIEQQQLQNIQSRQQMQRQKSQQKQVFGMAKNFQEGNQIRQLSELKQINKQNNGRR